MPFPLGVDEVMVDGVPQKDPTTYTDGPFWIYINEGLRHTAPQYVAQGYATYWDIDVSQKDDQGNYVNLQVTITSGADGTGWIRYYNYSGDPDHGGRTISGFANAILGGSGPVLLADLSWGRLGQRNVTYNADSNNNYPLVYPGGSTELQIIFSRWYNVLDPHPVIPRGTIVFTSDVENHPLPVGRHGLNVLTNDGWTLIGPPFVTDTPGTLFDTGPTGQLKLATGDSQQAPNSPWSPDYLVWVEDKNAFHSAGYFNGGDFAQGNRPMYVWDGFQWLLCTYLRQLVSAS